VVQGRVASDHGSLVILSRPGRSGGDEPGVEAIEGCVHKRRALNTRLSSGTSAGTFACPAGPYRNWRGEVGTKNKTGIWYQSKKRGQKVDPHVSNKRSRWFLFQEVQVHRYAGRRTDFRDKQSRDFSGEIFLERNYCPRTGFSGSNPWKNSSHPVKCLDMDRELLAAQSGGKLLPELCSLPGNNSNEGTPPDFERFFLEKRPWKRFSTNVLIRGKWIHSSYLMGTKLYEQ